MEKAKNIFITGGTSGIGLELAKHYLIKGNRVGVCGREISKVPKELLDLYPDLYLYELDVFDKENLKESISKFSDGKLDILVTSAGSYSNSRTKVLSKDEADQMLRVNIVGTINAFEVAKKIMLEQDSGQIFAIASVAGLFNYPGASVYSATKKVVINLSRAYNSALNPFGIHVGVVASGYIDTPRLREINGGDISKKPFVISLNKAQEKIVYAIENRVDLTIFPFRMKLVVKFLSFLPGWLLRVILLRGK